MSAHFTSLNEAKGGKSEKWCDILDRDSATYCEIVFEQRTYKSCFIVLLCIAKVLCEEKSSLMGMVFILFVELWVKYFQTYEELWVAIFQIWAKLWVQVFN